MTETPCCTAPNLHTSIYVPFENDFVLQPVRMARGGAEDDEGDEKSFSTGASLSRGGTNTQDCGHNCCMLCCQLTVLLVSCGMITRM
eukprot:3563737-Rhodomonas_salina.1